jgi:hypothetical protein
VGAEAGVKYLKLALRRSAGNYAIGKLCHRNGALQQRDLRSPDHQRICSQSDEGDAMSRRQIIIRILREHRPDMPLCKCLKIAKQIIAELAVTYRWK